MRPQPEFQALVEDAGLAAPVQARDRVELLVEALHDGALGVRLEAANPGGRCSTATLVCTSVFPNPFVLCAVPCHPPMTRGASAGSPTVRPPGPRLLRAARVVARETSHRHSPLHPSACALSLAFSCWHQLQCHFPKSAAKKSKKVNRPHRFHHLDSFVVEAARNIWIKKNHRTNQ